MTADTIAAISTAFGEAAISVLRVSGGAALTVADKILHTAHPTHPLTPRVAHFARVVDGEGGVIDEVLVTFFKGPASYTGEDVVEISCHGGILVTRRIFELLLKNGARAAEPGECGAGGLLSLRDRRSSDAGGSPLSWHGASASGWETGVRSSACD